MQLLIIPTLDLVILPYTSRPPCWVPAGLCFVSPLFFFFRPLFYHKDAVKYLSPSNNSICEYDQQNCCWCTSRRLNFDFCTSFSYIPPPRCRYPFTTKSIMFERSLFLYILHVDLVSLWSLQLRIWVTKWDQWQGDQNGVSVHQRQKKM